MRRAKGLVAENFRTQQTGPGTTTLEAFSSLVPVKVFTTPSAKPRPAAALQPSDPDGHKPLLPNISSPGGARNGPCPVLVLRKNLSEKCVAKRRCSESLPFALLPETSGLTPGASRCNC
jgi:hypothetical protein